MFVRQWRELAALPLSRGRTCGNSHREIVKIQKKSAIFGVVKTPVVPWPLANNTLFLWKKYTKSVSSMISRRQPGFELQRNV